jgi:predicted transposase/invertase (TIGR01784 family)
MKPHTPRNRFDLGFRRLFSQRRLVEELLRGFLGQPFVDRLDFQTLERANGDHVTRDLRSRQSDLVWKLQTRDGRPVYVYILLELQSTVDRFMAARMMAYVALLYLDLIDEGRLAPDGKLPLVIPVVLHNGEHRWTAAQDVFELVEAFDPEADSFRPRLKYWLIDERSYDLGELERRENVAARLFWLERRRDEAGFRLGVDRLVAVLDGPDDGALRSAIASYILLVLFPERGFTVDDVPEVMSLEEFRDMLADRIEVWSKGLLDRGRKEGRNEGRKEGRKEGQREGRREGEARLLLRLLERKFGTLDPATRERVESADARQLLAWGERILEAGRLEDVFEG